MPALFAHKLSRVGRDYDNLPDVRTNIFRACSSKQQTDSSADFEPIDDNIVIDPCKHIPRSAHIQIVMRDAWCSLSELCLSCDSC